MSDIYKPQDHKDIEAAVQWAIASGKTLEIVGHGSKRMFGRPAQYDATLDLSGMAGVILYEPQELVLSARAGTPLADITALLASNEQELAFEPMDYGPRRIRVGAARDHFLGVVAVSGRGETFKSGGRVVKNVTGFDLCKLLAGSWGTLGILTEVTLKVLPQAQAEATLVLIGLNDSTAAAAMATAMAAPVGVSGAAHLPDYVASRFDGLDRADASTVFRIEGLAASLDDCLAGLQSVVQPFGAVATLDEVASRMLWRAIRDVQPFWATGSCGDRPLWRISTTPSKGCEIAARISPASQLFYDWAGGLIWVAP